MVELGSHPGWNKQRNNFDLTVTTNSTVNVGDVVTFEGKIVLNKDFGYGYSYKVLLEDAKSSEINFI